MGLSNVSVEAFKKGLIVTYPSLKGNEAEFIYYVDDTNELYGNDPNQFYIYKKLIGP